MADALAVTTIANIPPDRYERIQQALEEKLGHALVGNSGDASNKYATIHYEYDGKSMLTISVTHTAHIFISPQHVISVIETAIQGIA